MAASTLDKCRTDLIVLGLIDEGNELRDPDIATSLFSASGSVRAQRLKDLLKAVPGGASAIAMLDKKPDSRSEQIGEIIREAYGLLWSDATIAMAGGKFRAWARAAGVKVLKPPRSDSNSAKL
jgi:hypothetical protein